MYRNHGDKHSKQSASGLQPRNVNLETTLKCAVTACDFSCIGLMHLFAHLRNHISCGIKVQCPFRHCTSTFTLKKSFSSHLSRWHKDWSNQYLSSVVTECQILAGGDMPSPSHDLVDSTENVAINDDDSLCEDAVDDDNSDQDLFVKSIATMYLKMQSQWLLPTSTIQKIIEQYQEIHDINQSNMYSCIKKTLGESGMDEITIQSVISELQSNDLFNESTTVLRSAQTRKTYFQKNFNYVPPQPVYLGLDEAGKERYFQYIPIKETLRSLFDQKSVVSQHQTSRRQTSDDEILEDIKDGKISKSNELIQSDPTAISVLLYQDAFEVVNPLGSGKKKHKLLAVYMSLSDLLPHNRSRPETMQLVLLCRENDFKFFGQNAVFTQLLRDLKDLETEGVLLRNGSTVKVVVGAIAGDNLGSHCIGGFNENFSRSIFFCRYCLIDRATFRDSPLHLGEKRTPQNYDETVNELANNAAAETYGIKFNSIFNELVNFHVCQPGLPPCLAHDLFEGIVAIDLALYIRYFVGQKFFTYQQFNRSVSKFKYKGSDADSKPCEIAENAEKLAGNASQNWCLLRLLPFHIGQHILNPISNDVWQLCLKLRQIVDRVCAPKISKAEVACLRVLIEEYLTDRVSLFPDIPLKPKHHYLLHYPQMILNFGPLIKVWTLRFESKHSYFKECVRKIHNFKNLTQTLAERHQLLQAYLLSGSLFPSEIQPTVENDFFPETYNTQIQECTRNLNFSTGTTTVAQVVKYKGTVYKAGMCVALEAESEQSILFGLVKLILVHENQKVWIVAEKCLGNYLIDLGLYALELQGNYVCKNIDALADYHPVQLYNYFDFHFVSLHHAVPLQQVLHL